MFEEPIRRRVNAYPKDFTPPETLIHAKISSKYTYNEQFSINHVKDKGNKSVRLQEEFQDFSERKMFTLNPEQQKIAVNDVEIENPLVKQNMMRKKPIINEQLLAKPRIVSKIEEDLAEVEEPDDSPATPGSIKANKTGDQKPLSEEKPVQVKEIKMEEISNKKIQQTHHSFRNSMRPSLFNSISSRQKKFPSLRNDNEGGEKLLKRFSNQKEFTQGNKLLYKPESEQKLMGKKKMRIGYLFEESKLNKLKEEINSMTEEKVKNKKQTTKTQNSNKTFFQPSKTHLSNFRSRKTAFSAHRAYPELGRTLPFHEVQRQQQEKHHKVITVSYKTSLSNLKEIYSLMKVGRNLNIQMKIPTVFMQPKFQQDMPKQQLYEIALQLFTVLNLPSSNLNVKKYSNCVFLVCKNVAIIWHYNSKVYLGGWKNQYLDEGVRNGLGLEWVPNKHMYYGQFSNNKKHGLGMLKTVDETFIGFWENGSRTDKGYIVKADGTVFLQSNCPVESFPDHFGVEEFERDPFL